MAKEKTTLTLTVDTSTGSRTQSTIRLTDRDATKPADTNLVVIAAADTELFKKYTPGQKVIVTIE